MSSPYRIVGDDITNQPAPEPQPKPWERKAVALIASLLVIAGLVLGIVAVVNGIGG